jgi:hypothetical protein
MANIDKESWHLRITSSLLRAPERPMSASSRAAGRDDPGLYTQALFLWKTPAISRAFPMKPAAAVPPPKWNSGVRCRLRFRPSGIGLGFASDAGRQGPHPAPHLLLAAGDARRAAMSTEGLAGHAKLQTTQRREA